jgi:NADPH:quinone reductase-like Zn-dependent oxidoreductase
VDEVLVRVHATSVHADVWHVVAGRPYAMRLMGAGLRRPKSPVPGTDVSGIVEAVGANVDRFVVGDEVFGETVRGHPWHNGGAWAELVAAPATKLVSKPRDVPHEHAAAVATTGMIALDLLLAQGRMRDGAHVLVNGAAGAVGSIVVQLALAHDGIVTAVDSATKLPLLRTLGAQHVIDCATVDYTAGTERYDVIVDIPGNHHWKRNLRVLTPGGVYVPVGHEGYGQAGRWLGAMRQIIPLAVRGTWNRSLAGFSTGEAATDRLARLARLLETGQLTPHIDRTYPLQQAPQALRHLMSGTVQGRIVLTPATSSPRSGAPAGAERV